MGFLDSLLSLGRLVLVATIFVGVLVALIVYDLLDDAGRILIGLFNFLFIQCGGLFIEALGKLIDQL